MMIGAYLKKFQALKGSILDEIYKREGKTNVYMVMLVRKCLRDGC